MFMLPLSECLTVQQVVHVCIFEVGWQGQYLHLSEGLFAWSPPNCLSQLFPFPSPCPNPFPCQCSCLLSPMTNNKAGPREKKNSMECYWYNKFIFLWKKRNMTHNSSRSNVLDLNGLLELMAATRMQCSSIWTLYLSLHHPSITTLKFSPWCSLNLKFLRDKNMLRQIPSFVVIGTKVKQQAVKTALPSEIMHFLWRGCFCAGSHERMMYLEPYPQDLTNVMIFKWAG